MSTKSEHNKILALVKAKKEKQIANFYNIDGRYHIETIVSKWKKISKHVMNVSNSTHFRNCLTYKDKWVSIFGDFKNVYDYMASIGKNEKY
jgi:hypothetical protein